LANQKAKLWQEESELHSVPYKNTHSDRINKKNRNEEPIEIRLTREGKLSQNRIKEKLDKENRSNNHQNMKHTSRSKKRVRTNSALTQPKEIILSNKGNIHYYKI
jgi:hypothetical protein